jgi:hypothetical protein
LVSWVVELIAQATLLTASIIKELLGKNLSALQKKFIAQIISSITAFRAIATAIIIEINR